MYARDAKSVKDHLNNLVLIGAPPDNTAVDNHRLVTRGQRGAVVGALNRFMGGDEHRRAALSWLFDYSEAEISSSQLSNDQWYALFSWCDFRKDDEVGGWRLPPTFPMECANVVGEAIKRIKAMPLIAQPEWSLQMSFLLNQTLIELGGDLLAVAEWDSENFTARHPNVLMPYERPVQETFLEPEPAKEVKVRKVKPTYDF
jgi:hypothetical protein